VPNDYLAWEAGCYKVDKDDVLQRKDTGGYVEIGKEIGGIVDEKQEQYGDSFGRAGRVLQELFPCGIEPDQYDDVLAIARILDKLFRIANGDKGDESAYRDIAGYGILGEGKGRTCAKCKWTNRYNYCFARDSYVNESNNACGLWVRRKEDD